MSAGAGATEDLAAEVERLREEVAQLRESEKMYRFSAEISGRLVWSTDPEGQVTSMSRMFTILSGLPDEEALKAGWIEFVHEGDRDRVLESWFTCLRTGEPLSIEFRVRLADGAYRTVLSKALPVRDREGKILRWYGSTQDVHEERMAEEQRRQVEERYRLAVQATNDAVWDCDLVNRVVDWSDSSAVIFGADEPIGRTGVEWWRDRLHPEDRTSVLQNLAEVIGSDLTHWSSAYRFRREDGTYADILDRGFIIRDAEGQAIRSVGAMADLTERHRAEAEISRMQAELIHVSRLSAMGTMASTLAHELNQPLAAVSNYVSAAKRIAAASETADPGLLDALQSAETGTLRAGEIVRRLREIVSRGTISAVFEDLPKLIEEAGVLAFVDAGLLGIRHSVKLDPAAQWIAADRIQMQQVLINLIRNAVEAMEPQAGGEVTISTRALVGSNMVQVCVADTGPGIEPALIGDLFSQFMTTKSGGLGIGLPICRTIIEAHGGAIWAENREQGGAVFCFTVPRALRTPDGQN